MGKSLVIEANGNRMLLRVGSGAQVFRIFKISELRKIQE
jgi:hypothetical protein